MTSSALPTSTAPLNLAALMGTVPPVVLPNGVTRELVWSARGAELFRKVRHLTAAATRGEAIDDLEAERIVDECLAAVIKDATADDLLSFRENVNLKLTVLAAASGRLDRVLQALAQAQGESGNATAVEASPPLDRDTTSAP